MFLVDVYCFIDFIASQFILTLKYQPGLKPSIDFKSLENLNRKALKFLKYVLKILHYFSFSFYI
jgi:hypothetical protein